MRKWFLIAMSAVGMTLFMLIGLGDMTSEEAPDPYGQAFAPETGRTDEAVAPRVSLRAVVSMDAATFAALLQATERFERERPNVTVEVTNATAAALRSRYRPQTETGEAPDILLYPTEWVRREAAAGRLQPLDDYVAAERQTQWFETVRGAVRWNGYLWGVPADWDPYVFVYRADSALAAKAGDDALTVSDYLAADDAGATDEAEDDYGARLLAAGTAQADSGAVSASAPESDEPAEAEAVAAATAPADAPALRSDSIEKLASGGGEGWTFLRLSEAIRGLPSGEEAGEWLAAAYVPDEDAKPAALPPFAGNSYVVTASAAHPAEAAEWIRYVTGDGTSGASAAEARWPVTRSAFGLPSPLAARSAAPGSEEAGASLPAAQELDAPELRFALRPLMQAIDAVPAAYGPPVDLPPPPS